METNSSADKKTEFEKMIDSEPYWAFDPILVEMRNNAELIYKEYNNTTENDLEKRKEIYKNLFGSFGENLSIRAPFYCDYGKNTYLGKNVYMNFNCIILDVCRVDIGDYTMFAPGVQVITACHPTDPKTRLDGLEYGKPVKIGKNVWIGANALILPGVVIGDNCTIGAGSVVNKNIPDNSIAVGNPCKVIKKVEGVSDEDIINRNI